MPNKTIYLIKCIWIYIGIIVCMSYKHDRSFTYKTLI